MGGLAGEMYFCWLRLVHYLVFFKITREKDIYHHYSIDHPFPGGHHRDPDILVKEYGAAAKGADTAQC